MHWQVCKLYIRCEADDIRDSTWADNSTYIIVGVSGYATGNRYTSHDNIDEITTWKCSIHTLWLGYI